MEYDLDPEIFELEYNEREDLLEEMWESILEENAVKEE